MSTKELIATQNLEEFQVKESKKLLYEELHGIQVKPIEHTSVIIVKILAS